jgi:hypothetical protein
MKKPSRTDWARIDAIEDDEIDYSDNPELGDDFSRKQYLGQGTSNR